jgi:hypothetical protein
LSDFVNITSADNWFKKHPEKIAGEEFESTSFMFPIQVRGTKEDVERVINSTLKSNKNQDQIKIAEAEAEALMLEILLQ